MAGLLSTEARSWIGRSEPPVRVEITRREIIKYAAATEQVQEKYLRGDEAPPMYIFGLFREIATVAELGPDGLPPQASMPELALKRTMAGGTRLNIHRAVKPGETLVGTRTLVDIFEKDGRQGPLIFLVNELEITTENGDRVIEEIQTRIAR